MTRYANIARSVRSTLLALMVLGAAGAGDAVSWQADSSEQSSTTSDPHAELALTRYEFHEPHMGTLVRVVLYARDERHARRASRAAFDRVAALDRALSDYQSTSELSRLGARAGQGPVAVSADLFRVLTAAQSLAVRSHGAFDVTSGPLTRLWREARRLGALPAGARVDAARAKTGFHLLRLDKAAQTVTLERAGMALDVGGIAKGDAADQALAVVARTGVTRALIAIGGDVAVSAPPPGRDGWTIEIASLDVPGAPRPVKLRLHDVAVSTAGDAEQWMAVAGRRYSHILDPRTGWPMTIRSQTTVIARRGLDADGLDTAAAVLGPDEGVRLVEETAGAAVFMVRQEADGRVTVRRSSRWPNDSQPGVVAGSLESACQDTASPAPAAAHGVTPCAIYMHRRIAVERMHGTARTLDAS